MWSKIQAWEMWPNGWPDCGMLFLTQLNEDTIYLWCMAGFVVVCWANIVGDIISGEKRCN